VGRSGFVLNVDDRTPPLIVPSGDGFFLERLPLGSKVIYPAESLDAVPDLGEAVGAALDAPLESPPLNELLRPGMKLTIAFDDNTVPTPTMRRPDVRGAIIEAVLSRAAHAGVDDVELICANGLNRRVTAAEFTHLLGERVFRSFYADEKLSNHDAEDHDALSGIGSTSAGEVAVNARVADSDLVVYVHLVVTPKGGGAESFAQGLGSAGTIGQISGYPASAGDTGSRDAVIDLISSALPILQIDAVLDNHVFPPVLEFLSKREWEWRLKDQARFSGLRRGLAATPTKLRHRMVNRAQAGYRATSVTAGAPAAVRAASRRQILAQQVVEVSSQADVGVIGVPQRNPYSADSVTNPVLSAWLGLGAFFGAHAGRPFVREGGALVMYSPMVAEFSPLHHPSYVDFFADVLSSTQDPAQIAADFETKFATDPWYAHLYRTSYAFHGVHPCYLWYQIAEATRHLSDVVWVGADRSSVDRLGFRAASTLADALEIVAASVGRTPAISYLHVPPQIVVDVR
jgi:lactate racemase